MRSLLLWLITLLVAPVFAQRGKVTYEDRRTMLNDSVRQVDRVDVEKDRLIDRRFYVGNRPTGVWQEFDKRGKLLAERDFSKLRYGKTANMRLDEVHKALPAATDTFTIIESMPIFPGGEAELFKFLGGNIKYPAASQDEGESGIVYLVGIVDETGVWRNETILKGAHPLLDYEAWRVCGLMPQWTPGTQGGKPVKVQYNLPIRFTLR